MTDDLEAQLGDRLRRLRIRHALTQAELAARANLSVHAIQRLEQGRGQIRSLLLVLRAAGAEDALQQWLPEPTVSPLALARRKPERQRVRVPKS